MVRLFVFVGLLFVFCSSNMGQASAQLVDQTALENPVDEARARALMSEIRCLVCQNQSIEDSNADLAITLRQIVREQVAAGKTNEQIKTYLVARYGEWVLMRPAVNARTYLLWGGPLVILFLGAGGLFIRARKANPKTAKQSKSLSAKEQAELEAILAKPSAGDDEA